MDIPHPHPIYSLLIFFLGRCLSKKRGLWNLGFEWDKHVIFVLMMNCHRKFLKISISHKEVHGSINESPWNPDSDSFSVQYPLDLQSLCWFFSHSWVKLVMLYVKCKDKWVIHYWVLTAKCKCVICEHTQSLWAAPASCGSPNISDLPRTSEGWCISEGSAWFSCH